MIPVVVCRRIHLNEGGGDQSVLWSKFYESVRVCNQVEATCEQNKASVSRGC